MPAKLATKKLKVWRVDADLTQKALAVKAGVDQGTISKIENAVGTVFEPATMEKITKALDLANKRQIKEFDDYLKNIVDRAAA